MKKILKNKLFLILSAPIMSVIGLWTVIAMFLDKGAFIPFFLLIIGLVATAINALWHLVDKDVEIKVKK